MRKLDVSIEINGRMREVGSIVGENEYNAGFTYSMDYLASETARPISIALPLREETFGPLETGIFFEGLLPEGFLRRKISENNRADSNDYLALLEMLGGECLGAVQIKGEGFVAVEPEYRELSPEYMMEIAAEGASKSADLVVESHLSLTGASGKIGAYRDKDARWFLPVGSAPSTHIVKQSHIRYNHIVQNEQLAMKTAELLGIEVPRTIIVNTGGKMQDGANETSISRNLLFAAERYDRTMKGSETVISGLPAPRRLHQEDFCQALGIPSADKYEHAGGGYMKRLFDLLAERSASPIEDQMKLWDIISFHYMIGNTDGHIKNLSLLYDSNLRSVRLAPAYDIVSTIIYDKHSSEMAFSIGGETEWSSLGRENFAKAAAEIGLNKRILMERFDKMSENFDSALVRAADELTDLGYEEVKEIAEKIRLMKKQQGS